MPYTDEVLSQPVMFEYAGRAYEVPWNCIRIWDDPAHAEWLAGELGTLAKHAANKFSDPSWHTVSIVQLP